MEDKPGETPTQIRSVREDDISSDGIPVAKHGRRAGVRGGEGGDGHESKAESLPKEKGKQLIRGAQ